MTEFLTGGAAAAPLSMHAAASLTSAAIRAARQILIDLERGRRIDAAVMRRAVEAAFGASVASGAWKWKVAYDVSEAATVLLLRKLGPAFRAKANSSAAMLPLLVRAVSLLVTRTRHSDWHEALLMAAPLGRAALRVHAASVMLDDSKIEWRVTLIRPMDGTDVPLTILAETHWAEAHHKRNAAACLIELAEASLLLLLWIRLPNGTTSVLRLQTNAGERIIRCMVWARWAATEATSLTLAPSFAAWMEGRTVLELVGELQLRRVHVIGAYLIDLSAFDEAMPDLLRAFALVGENISWKPRMLVPTEASGIAFPSRVLGPYPAEGSNEREVV